MTTTGHTPLAHILAMIRGDEEEPPPPSAKAVGTSS
jgi:hypothetical protein